MLVLKTPKMPRDFLFTETNLEKNALVTKIEKLTNGSSLLSKNWYHSVGEVVKLHAVKKSAQNWERVRIHQHAQKKKE